MDQRIVEHLRRNGMASLMNATKWRELAAALQDILADGPRVRIKYLLDDDPGPGFAHLDWEWVGEGDASIIEWIEIDPVERTYRGRRVADAERDHAESILATLKRIGVPFSVEGGLFKVWGHVRPNAMPTLV